MVINYNLDTDKFLTRNDFIRCINNDLIWPWPLTHFIVATECFGCGNILSGTQGIPLHFTSIMDTEQLIMLLGSTFFWCKYCEYAAYHHYPADECEFCY